MQTVEMLRAVLVLIPFLVLVGRSVRAQELTAGVGAMQSPDSDQTSYAWHIDYRRALWPHVSWSATWLNEGHVQGHHRDGLAGQLWWEAQSRRRGFAFTVGAGLYHFFDTQAQSDGDSLIDRAWAPIGSVAATYYTDGPWFVRLTANTIIPQKNITVNTLSLALGYRLGEARPALRANAEPTMEAGTAPWSQLRNEVTFFYGKTVVNASVGRWNEAYSIEYRRRVARYAEVSAGWLKEGHAEVLDRDGPVVQAWLVDSWKRDRVSLGIGAGLYYSTDRHRAANGGDRHHLMQLVSPTVAYRFSRDWVGRFVWHRVITDYHRDTDVFLAGIGRRW